MVLGADKLLEYYSNGKNKITLEISENPIVGYVGILLKSQIAVVGQGEDYYVQFNQRTRYDFSLSGTIWLCDVTKFVFNGKFPNTIYVKI